jgi:hypothetical protein
VGLTFDIGTAPAASLPRRLEVLVFINDEDEKTEECFRIQVNLEI